MKLKKINLKKGDGHNHPDIKPGKKYYLVKVHGQLFVGHFSRQWYGLNFDHWGTSGLQFDTPGTNASKWQEVWEVIS